LPTFAETGFASRSWRHDSAQHCREPERHTDVGDAVEQDCPARVGATLADERGERGRRKRERRDEHEEGEVFKKQDAINAMDQREERVMIHPDHADDEEADEIGGEGRPGLGKLARETAVAGCLDVKVEDEQRDRHGEDAVAERLGARFLLSGYPARFLTGMGRSVSPAHAGQPDRQSRDLP